MYPSYIQTNFEVKMIYFTLVFMYIPYRHIYMYVYIQMYIDCVPESKNFTTTFLTLKACCSICTVWYMQLKLQFSNASVVQNEKVSKSK